MGKVDAIGKDEREQVYLAISDERAGFTVWHLSLDKRGESV